MEASGDVLELQSSNFRERLESLLDARRPRAIHQRLSNIRTFNFNESIREPVSAAFYQLSAQIMRRQARHYTVALNARCESTAGLKGVKCWALANAGTLTNMSLHIGPAVPFDDFHSLLQAFTDRLPMLQILKLDAELEHLKPGQRLDLALEVTRLCGSLHALSTLHVSLDIVDSVWRSFFAVLSQLHQLREIKFVSSAIDMSVSNDSTYRVSSSGFNNLRILDVSAPPSRCAQVLRSLSASISKLHWECPHLSEENQLGHTLAEVASFTLSTTPRILSRSFSLSPSAMNTLFTPWGIPIPVLMSSLTEVFIDIVDARPELMMWTGLKSLFRARGMRTFSVRCPYPLSYSSEELRDLFQAWPVIQRLSLNPRPSRGMSSRDIPPLGMLADVATSAPCLEVFEALLDGNLLSSIPPRTWAPNVTRLDLGHSVGPGRKSEVVVARGYIDRLFPDVSIVEENCSTWVQLLVHVNAVS